MKTIRIEDIQVSPHRQRREFDPVTLNALAEDIQANGLFNAIVLRGLATSYMTGDKPLFQLCQGERRLRAIADLRALGGDLRYDGELVPDGWVPYVTLGDLDPLQAELCELSENINRDDLTWQEKAAATARIMRIRTEMAATSETWKPAPTVADIATEVRGSALGQQHEDTRREILLADLVKKDPEIAKANSIEEAWKIAKRKEQTRRNEELGALVGKTFSAKSHTILNRDAVPWLESCADELFDVILTDPPYGIGADEFGDSGGRTGGGTSGEHKYTDDDAAYQECLQALLTRGYSVAKPQAHLYMFCDIDRFLVARDLFEIAGWWVHRTPFVWHKTNGSRVPWPDNGPQRKYELILYAVKGKRPVTGIYPDVLSYPTETNLGHQAQKPVALYADLLRRSARPGDSALDPFAGSGPLLPAAHGLSCLATLIEKDQGSYGIILNRAKELK